MLPACIGTHPEILSSLNQSFQGPQLPIHYCLRITYLYLSDLLSASCVRTGCESIFLIDLPYIYIYI